jgi:60 kDa SS-A/Ro ribonucleoprotein
MGKLNQKVRTKSPLQVPPLFGTTPLPVQARTHEGGPAITFTPDDQLRRAVLTCMLWESGHYESGQAIAGRIADLVKQVDPEYVKTLARVARYQFKMRHVPLFLVVQLLKLRTVKDMDELVYDVIQRADEPAELVAMYWKDGKRPLAAALKRGLAAAITKFDEYQLMKWRGSWDTPVKLRDVMFLSHAKPLTDSQAAMWKRFVNGDSPLPDTWENALAAGQDKKATFERLLAEGRLGYMALLRNMRSMHAAGVAPDAVSRALMAGAKRSMALPFRYIAAARACPQWEPFIDAAMQAALTGLPRLPGVTDLIVDVSGSMDRPLAKGADLRRLDAACALAILLRGIGDEVRVFSFSERTVAVAPRTGIALRDAIVTSQPHQGTYLGQALASVASYTTPPARTIVITDEQSHDAVGAPRGKGYMLDVAGAQNGVGYGNWTWISGFSEAVVNYIQAVEGVLDVPVLEANDA